MEKNGQDKRKGEHNIWWHTEAGKISFWFDNWTKLGALYNIEANNTSEEEIEVTEFVEAGQWDKMKLLSYLSDEELVNYICEDITPPQSEEGLDRAW